MKKKAKASQSARADSDSRANYKEYKITIPVDGKITIEGHQKKDS